MQTREQLTHRIQQSIYGFFSPCFENALRDVLDKNLKESDIKEKMQEMRKTSKLIDYFFVDKNEFAVITLIDGCETTEDRRNVAYFMGLRFALSTSAYFVRLI